MLSSSSSPALELVQAELGKLKESDGQLAATLESAVSALQTELASAQQQNKELSGYTEQALEQAETLKQENEGLLKAKEDAVLEGQLARKLSETEKLATASTAYKKDLLQQNLAKKDQEVQQANDRLRAADRQIKSLTTQLSELRNAHREVATQLDDLKERGTANAASQTSPSPPSPQPAANSTDGAALPVLAADRDSLGDEHEALAARLLDGGLEKLDSATVAAAAAGLRDTSVLEKQLKRARDEIERLQREIQQLNETVFSKSFKAPSAWAEREVKYKAEKRAWEQQVAGLKEQIRGLSDENRGYRESNKAAEFEDQIKELKAAVKRAEADRTLAQQGLHELQLQMREAFATRASARNERLAPKDANVHGLISAMEEQGIGVQQPRTQSIKASHRRTSSGGALPRTSSTGSLEAFPVAGANLQEIIDDYDDQGIGMAGPFARRKSRRPKPEGFTGRADVAAGDPSDDNLSADLEGIRIGLRTDASRRASKAGSEVDSETLSRRPTWTAELPELPTAAASHPAVAAEPSRLHAVSFAEERDDAARAATDPGHARSSGTDFAPASSSGERHLTGPQGSGGSQGQRGNAAVNNRLAQSPFTEQSDYPEQQKPGSSPHLQVEAERPGVPVEKPAAQEPLQSLWQQQQHQSYDKSHQYHAGDPSAQPQQADVLHGDSLAEGASTAGAVHGAVGAHGVNPSLPASHDVQRDWVSQRRPEEAARPDEGSAEREGQNPTQQVHGLPLDRTVGEPIEGRSQGGSTEAALTDEAGAWPEGHSSRQQDRKGLPLTVVATSVADESAEAQIEGGDAVRTETADQPGAVLGSRQETSAAAADSKPPLPSGHPVDISSADVASDLGGTEVRAAGPVSRGLEADARQPLSATHAGNEAGAAAAAEGSSTGQAATAGDLRPQSQAAAAAIGSGQAATAGDFRPQPQATAQTQHIGADACETATMQPSESAAEALPTSEQLAAAPSDAAAATFDARDSGHLQTSQPAAQESRPQAGPQLPESGSGPPATAVASPDTEAYGGTHAAAASTPVLATSDGGPGATAAAASPAAADAAYMRAGLPPESVASETGTLSTLPDSLMATGDEDVDIPDSAAEAYRSTAEAPRPGAPQTAQGVSEVVVSNRSRDCGHLDFGHLSSPKPHPELPSLLQRIRAIRRAKKRSAPPPSPDTGGISRQVGPEVDANHRTGLGAGPMRPPPDRSNAANVLEIEPLDEDGSAAPPLQRLRTDSLEAELPGQPNGRGVTSRDSRLLSRASSDSDSPWTQEKLSALQQEKTSVEAEWQEHVADQDIGTLKWRAAELSSRVEMHEAQIMKMQRALEHADEEKARLEEDLEIAMAAATAATAANSLPPDQQPGLKVIQDRLRKVVSLKGPQSSTQRIKETEGALQQAYREVASLQRQREELQKQLARIATKISSGIIPAPEDLELPPLDAGDPASAGSGAPGSDGAEVAFSAEEGADGSAAAANRRQFAAFIGGLSDEEIEVMTLRQENENMMETLVRTKVELAETQGDYLKMRRALIRAVEKQAALADRLDSLRTAFGDGDTAGLQALMQQRSEPRRTFSGDIESLGERSRF